MHPRKIDKFFDTSYRLSKSPIFSINKFRRIYNSIFQIYEGRSQIQRLVTGRQLLECVKETGTSSVNNRDQVTIDKTVNDSPKRYDK
jgi:hypothetical protein